MIRLARALTPPVALAYTLGALTGLGYAGTAHLVLDPRTALAANALATVAIGVCALAGTAVARTREHGDEQLPAFVERALAAGGGRHVRKGT